MDESLLVKVVDSGANLNEEVESRVLTEILLLPNQVEQVPLRCILQGQVDRCLVLEASIQPTDVLVVQLLLYPNLPDQCFFYFAARKGRLFYLLDGDLDTGIFVLC